jgi:hypothetical protein
MSLTGQLGNIFTLFTVSKTICSRHKYCEGLVIFYMNASTIYKINMKREEEGDRTNIDRALANRSPFLSITILILGKFL